jgi:hypothetical protein
MNDFEKLGAFYLGRVFDPQSSQAKDELLLYDSKDLTTHAVCLGMTGSGKTGLCLALLEEAGIDGIPAIAIDPKGDLANLFLTFPELRPEDLRPWVDEGEATRSGMSAEQYAAQVANTWKQGLSRWGQDGERIRRFREACELALYTPGMSGGRPLRVLRSLAAPAPELAADPDALRDRVQGTVSGLLALLGIEADPVRSREHILLTQLIDRAWRAGRDYEIASLIGEVQAPPFDRLGVMGLETFFPSKDRAGLAMALNGLLASPGFGAWMEGEPLDIGRLLYTEQGKPRMSVLAIAHLSERERMFFVTLLLNEIVAWVRTQPGTSSLRAIVYMDEVFGFFPPTANPPSKAPMLTLLKQARAQGLGVVLATQNPVDLDYKGLSNMGTWFLGRLQTERDKARVLDGLEGAAGDSGTVFDRADLDGLLSGLDSRVFLLNNVHEDAPELFKSRWCLSYLRGPLTRNQIRELARRERPPAPQSVAEAGPVVERMERPETASGEDRPVLAGDIPQVYLGHSVPVPSGARLIYRPALLGSAELHYVHAPAGIDLWRSVHLLAPLNVPVATDPWEGAQVLEPAPEFAEEPDPQARYARLPAAAMRVKRYTSWTKRLKTTLYREQPLMIRRCAELKAYSTPAQGEGEFMAALAQRLHERRDLEMERLRKRYAPKLARLQDRIRQAEARVEREHDQHTQQKLQAAISLGATVLGALFGRKLASARTVGRATTTLRGAGRIAREQGDVQRAGERLVELQGQLHALEAEFEQARERLQDRQDPSGLEITEVLVRPRKTHISVIRVALAWVPWIVDEDGIAVRGDS